MVIKYGMHVPVTREQLLAAGAVEPTPQERAEMTAAYEEGRARDARYAAGLVKFRAALAEVSDPVARAVLDLHVENENGDCEGDELAGYEVEEPEWPCETVGTVAAVLGIPVPSRWT